MPASDPDRATAAAAVRWHQFSLRGYVTFSVILAAALAVPKLVLAVPPSLRAVSWLILSGVAMLALWASSIGFLIVLCIAVTPDDQSSKILYARRSVRLALAVIFSLTLFASCLLQGILSDVLSAGPSAPPP